MMKGPFTIISGKENPQNDNEKGPHHHFRQRKVPK